MCIVSLSKVLVTPKVHYLETCSNIKRIMQRCGVPGMSVAVLHKNQLIFAEAFGKRNQTDPYTIEVSHKDPDEKGNKERKQDGDLRKQTEQ